MEVGNSELNIFLIGNTPLPDVFLLHLAKHYLSEKDCISLVISGASDRFSFLFWSNRKRLVIGQCSFLSPVLCSHLFLKHFNPLLLTSFDASHCHWLPAKTLVRAITPMHNLEELSIHDTKLSLAHLLRVFRTCIKVKKLSLNLYESNLDAYQEDVDCFYRGFGRLTHLKIIRAVPQSEATYLIDAWPVILEVLSWCRDCVSLHIEIAYAYLYSRPHFLRAHNEAVLNRIKRKFKFLLRWMISLESLVIIPRGNDTVYYPPEYQTDPFVIELLKWMFVDLNMPPQSLKRLWILQDSTATRSLSVDHFFTSPKALNLWTEDGVRTELDHPKFRQMEYLGGIDFSNSLAQMTQLIFAIGNCVDDHGLSEFCRHHQNLEYLYFNTSVRNYDDLDDRQDYAIGGGNWTLTNLKTLGYVSTIPQQDVMVHLIKNCPNIEVLNLCDTLTSDEGAPMDYDISFLSRIQFHRLTKLNLDYVEMLDGDFLIPMVKQCPKLKILHIAGSFTPKVFLSNLAKCLPFAENLRDLRLEWYREEKPSSILLLLQKLVNNPKDLERLGLFNAVVRKPVNWSSPQMEHVLVEFATEMKRLVALCFSNFLISSNVLRKVKRRLKKEMNPLRPSFWFYIDRYPPLANDTTVPRIHYDGIVCPVAVFRSAPSNFF